jgi:hypothetical protein
MVVPLARRHSLRTVLGVATPFGLASSFVRLSRTSEDKSEATLHGWRPHLRKSAFICGSFVFPLRLCVFA